MDFTSLKKTSTTSWGHVAEYVGELIKIVIIASAIILPIRLFVVQPFYVKGLSMYPTFDGNDYLLVDEISYHFRKPARGDVVVFAHNEGDRKYFIKRVVGLPGETVDVTDDAVTIFNIEHPDGILLDESEYTPLHGVSPGVRTTLQNDEYFVLGDNRPVSYDSRRFGPIKPSAIVGRVVLRGLPIDKFHFFLKPQYNTNIVTSGLSSAILSYK
ncbi:MAG: signal peptidase I [bacterium]|nr:signal peptidase I [bacterium]